jgi:hypothetical protein
MNDSVIVVFRVFKKGGDVLALFPHETWDGRGHCASYQHIGQHSGADYAHCIQATRPARPSEYRALKTELERIGYRLIVRSRAGRKQ